MAERWIVNASPLIALGRIGRLELLAELAAEVVTPEAVAAEVRRGDDEAAAYVSRFPVVPVETHPLVAPWGLGAGETAVLSLAKSRDGYVAVLDDLAARRCAAALSISTRGTVGILLLAKKRALIPSAGDALSELRSAGFFISADLVAHALSLVGEGREP